MLRKSLQEVHKGAALILDWMAVNANFAKLHRTLHVDGTSDEFLLCDLALSQHIGSLNTNKVEADASGL